MAGAAAPCACAEVDSAAIPIAATLEYRMSRSFIADLLGTGTLTLKANSNPFPKTLLLSLARSVLPPRRGLGTPSKAPIPGRDQPPTEPIEEPPMLPGVVPFPPELAARYRAEGM